MGQQWCGGLLAAILLISAGCNQTGAVKQNPQGDALVQAARGGNADTVKVLLSAQGTDVNATDERGNTALLEAARFGHDDVARALLAAGANAKVRDRDGRTPLMLAIAGGHNDVVKVLKQAGAIE